MKRKKKKKKKETASSTFSMTQSTLQGCKFYNPVTSATPPPPPFFFLAATCQHCSICMFRDLDTPISLLWFSGWDLWFLPWQLSSVRVCLTIFYLSVHCLLPNPSLKFLSFCSVFFVHSSDLFCLFVHFSLHSGLIKLGFRLIFFIKRVGRMDLWFEVVIGSYDLGC